MNRGVSACAPCRGHSLWTYPDSLLFNPHRQPPMPDIPAIAIFGTSFLVGLSGAASPGPPLAHNIRETVRRGFIAGPLVALGHSLLELATVALLAVGLAQIPESSLAVSLIGIVGGAFLVWMGGGVLRKPEDRKSGV